MEELKINKCYTLTNVFNVANKAKPVRCPLRMPLAYLQNAIISFQVDETVTEVKEVQEEPKKNAFQLLMRNSKSEEQLKKKIVKTKKDELYNSVLDLLNDAKFSRMQVNSAEGLLNVVTEAL